MTIDTAPDTALQPAPASLHERAALLRREQPAAAAAVEQHVEALQRSGLCPDEALRRGLEALGR